MPIRLTRAVKILLISCLALFVIQHTADQFLGMNILGWLALVPSAFVLDHRIWQIFTYSFLHADVMHLFLNLMMLAFMGGELEATWGTARFVKFYFFCSVSAGLSYLLLGVLFPSQGIHTPMVGASGAIYGLLMAYGLIFGERVLLFMMLFPMKAKYFIWILAGLELMTTVFSGNGGLASIAHLGGMAAGFGYLWGQASFLVWKKRKVAKDGRSGRLSKKRRSQPQHLKLVINNANKVELQNSDDGSDEPPTFH
ncbi:rhomboid family intramembrane serine protease [Bdellovibrionota bacterium FG-1]